MSRVSIPDVADKFAAYYAKNPVWGSLHIVLDDGNVDDSSVQFCLDWAQERGDAEGYELGLLLMQMSKTQRKKLPHKVER